MSHAHTAAPLVLGWVRSLFKHPLAVLGAETSGFRRVHEVDQSRDELLRRLDLREVANTLDDHQSAPRNGLVCSMPHGSQG